MKINRILLPAAVAAVVAIAGSPRLRRPRRAGLEEIDDPAVAAAYDRVNDWPQFRLLRRLFLTRLGRYHPRGTLIDVGCGPGRLAFLIAGAYPDLHISGIDAAVEMVDKATAEAAARRLVGRVSFQPGDAADLPLPDSSVDFAVSTPSLHHWTDPAQGLGEIHRVLKPGGQLLLFDLRRDARRIFLWLLTFAQRVILPKALDRAGEPTGSLLASYTVPEMEDLLRASPFAAWEVDGEAIWAYAWAVKQSR